MAEAELPKYRNILTKYLNLSPKLQQSFIDVVTQVYPLRADRKKLQDFCDCMLNFKGQEYLGEKEYLPFYFKVAAPFVILQVAHYGSITAPESGLSFAQDEVAFGFPVEWYDLDSAGNQQFVDFFMYYPFLFVDDAYSRLSARQIWGWAKAKIKLDCRLPDLNLDNPAVLVSASRNLYPVKRPAGSVHSQFADFQPSPDAAAEPVRFLEVCQNRRFWTGLRSVGDALAAAPRALGSLLNALAAGFKTAGNLLSNVPDPGQIAELLGALGRLNIRVSQIAPGAFKGLSPLGNQPLAPTRIVTVKQFRDTEAPGEAVYQAVVSSALTTKITDGGPLFDPLAPDLSGGIEIKILRAADRPGSSTAATADGMYPFEPCKAAAEQPNPVDQLGIITDGYTQLGDCPAYLLRPILPGWLKADCAYQAADRQFWRTNQLTTFSTSNDPNEHIPRKGVPPGSPRPKYNAKDGSGGLEELKGPFTYESFSTRFIRLLADGAKLRKFIGDQQNEGYLSNDVYDFVPLPEVWLFIATLQVQESYQDRTLLFAIPGMLTLKADGTLFPALFAVYRFTEADWDYITENEVFGRFSLSSSLESPPSLWMDQAGAMDPPQLTVSSKIFVPEIRDRIEHKVEKKKGIAWITRATVLNSNLSFSIPESAFESAFVISLRQVIDATRGDSVAYQELVGMAARLTRPLVVDKVEEEVDFKLAKGADYKFLPIVENLGLTPDRHDDTAYYFDRKKASRLSGSLKTGTGTKPGLILAWRAGSGVWKRGTTP
jgi:hypothetical protein